LEDSYDQELTFLYRRLSSVEDLIRTLEEYDRVRPRPTRLPITEKTA